MVCHVKNGVEAPAKPTAKPAKPTEKMVPVPEAGHDSAPLHPQPKPEPENEPELEYNAAGVMGSSSSLMGNNDQSEPEGDMVQKDQVVKVRYLRLTGDYF